MEKKNCTESGMPTPERVDFKKIYLMKIPLFLFLFIFQKSSKQSSVTSPPINLFGKGCLSFNFFARGILLKGILLTKKMTDGMSTVIWDSSKIMLMAVWSRIKIPLIGHGEFRVCEIFISYSNYLSVLNLFILFFNFIILVV